MQALGPRLLPSDQADRVLQWLQAGGKPSQNVQAIGKRSLPDHVAPVALHLQSDPSQTLGVVGPTFLQ